MWNKPWQITVNPKGVHFCILKIIQYVSDSILFSTTKSKRHHTFNLFRLIWFLQNSQVSGLHLHSVSRCWGRSAFLTNMSHSGCTQGSLTNSQLLVWACWKRYKEIINWRTTYYIKLKIDFVRWFLFYVQDMYHSIDASALGYPQNIQYLSI